MARELGHPWVEADGIAYLCNGEHHALYGIDLVKWQLDALDWIDEVFARDRRDRKALREFIAMFLYRIEVDKRLPDGRQFALMSMNSLACDLGVSKPTAKHMIERASLVGRYKYLRDSYPPIIERVEATVDGAKAGLWGTGYAPVTQRVHPAQPGLVSLKDAEPVDGGSEKPSLISLGIAEPASMQPGLTSCAPGLISATPGLDLQAAGSISLGESEPSAPTVTFPPPIEKPEGYEEFIGLFLCAPGRKERETLSAYSNLLDRGYRPAALVEGARRYMVHAGPDERVRYPLIFLKDEGLVAGWCKKPKKTVCIERLKETPGGWAYQYRECLDFVGCAKDATREEAFAEVGRQIASGERQL